MDVNNDEFTPGEKVQKVTKYCSVPQCNNYYRPGLCFHLFPRENDRKRRWEDALKMGKPASSTMLVCGEHFSSSDYFPNGNNKRYRLYPNVVPNQKLPVRPLEKKFNTTPRKKARQARRVRAEGRSNAKQLRDIISEDESIVSEDEQLPEPPLSPPSPSKPFSVEKSTQANMFDNRTECLTHEEGFSFSDMISENSNDKATQVNLNKESNRPAKVNDQTLKPANLAEILSSDAKLFTFTGIHSLDMLDALVKCVSDIDIVASISKKALSLKNRILLTMVKIKMNMSFTAIAILFDISRQSCANYFHTTCPLLAKVLEVMIPWPEQEIIRCNLPLSFENYKKTRIVMDCAETTIEICECLKCRVLTYSQYKKRHTIKYCIGITPSGLIIYVSPCFGGRASDKLIVNQSGILDKLDVYDKVMVDKGFNIEEECLVRHLELVRSPFLRQKNTEVRKKLSREDALKTAEIARARVHVERAIQRLRQYDLIKGPVPWTLAPYFDNCLNIVVGLTNLGPPIMNIDKFM